MIDLRHMRKNIVFKLFDALIVPIVSCGCQVWLPHTNYLKGTTPNTRLSFKLLAQDPLEKLHLSFLKWTLGVGKYTSNAAVWGDTGRYPMVVNLSNQVYSYFRRLEQMDADEADTLVRHAFAEQRTLQLTWYKNLEVIHSALIVPSDETPLKVAPATIKDAMKARFIEEWSLNRQENKKLGFYNLIKESFSCETYLSINLSHKQSKRIAQLRTSAHRFNIETGRHDNAKRSTILNRLCYQCCTNDRNTMDSLAELPFFPPIIEDEIHVLRTCSLYEDLRHRLSQSAKTCLFSDIPRLFKDKKLIIEMAMFLVKIWHRRFPEKPTKNNTSKREKGKGNTGKG